MAGIGEIVQKPIPTCDKHSSDEVEVYCKDCSKVICFECSRIDHHGHKCESISKLSRTLRQQIPELCKQIRDRTLSRMQAELESVQSLQIRNKKLHEEELNSMEMLQERCIQTVKNAFKTNVEKSSEKLWKYNENLKAREQELVQKIEKLNVHVQAHQDSQLTYGKYEIIEMDEKLKEMTRGYDKMDTRENVYVSSVLGNLSPGRMKRLESCVQSILLEFWEATEEPWLESGKEKFTRCITTSSQEFYTQKKKEETAQTEQPAAGKPKGKREFSNLDVENTDLGSTTSLSYGASSGKGSFLTKEGIVVKVYCDSITKLNVDCIVNTANETLSHGAGVAYAISRAAGRELDQEGRAYVQKYGRIEVGKCCVTKAGHLNYDCVIHTVGPRWNDYLDKRQCLRLLREAVLVTFEEASKRKLRSIAVPAISSGMFAVPKLRCVEQYFKAVEEYCKTNGRTSSLKEIHFVDKDEETVKLIQEQFATYNWDRL